ncbi:hypothetical protein MAR_021393 [Mya arenaria]|uniref:C-type lectin domain-containing protein n=1 Tax=Mya arenaria TaxID=6604 RepID=A0ABY7EA64_MYAAR|nr:hypothetical protein MAR_021393 [Mya arenaria]
MTAGIGGNVDMDQFGFDVVNYTTLLTTKATTSRTTKIKMTLTMCAACALLAELNVPAVARVIGSGHRERWTGQWPERLVRLCQTWVISEVVKYPPSFEWWIGLKRSPDNETRWLWTDGSMRNESNKFIMLGSWEPNNYLDSEDCGEIWDNLLNDKDCNIPLQSICDRPQSRWACIQEKGTLAAMVTESEQQVLTVYLEAQDDGAIYWLPYTLNTMT